MNNKALPHYTKVRKMYPKVDLKRFHKLKEKIAASYVSLSNKWARIIIAREVYHSKAVHIPKGCKTYYLDSKGIFHLETPPKDTIFACVALNEANAKRKSINAINSIM